MAYFCEMVCEKSKDQFCKVFSYEANVRLLYDKTRKPGIKQKRM